VQDSFAMNITLNIVSLLFLPTMYVKCAQTCFTSNCQIIYMNVVSSDIKHHILLHHKTVYKLLNIVDCDTPYPCFRSSDKTTRGIFSFFFYSPPQKKKTATCTYSTENKMLVNIYRKYKCIYPNEVGINL
jgi:hypothetical protein